MIHTEGGGRFVKELLDELAAFKKEEDEQKVAVRSSMSLQRQTCMCVCDFQSSLQEGLGCSWKLEPTSGEHGGHLSGLFS